MKQPVENYRESASNLYQNKKYREVIELLTDEILKTFTDAELYAWRSRAHGQINDHVDLIMLYAQTAIDIDKQYFMGYLARGNAWSKKEELDIAIEDYSKAIELNPEYATVYYNRGNTWSKKEELDKAIVDYSKAIELNPEYATVYYNRGNVWSQKEELDKAIADYSKAIELNPEYAAPYNNRGNAWKKKEELDKAIADYSKAIELKPEDATAYYNRGNAWKKKEELDKAIADYSKVIELKPEEATAYYNRGNAWRRKDEPDKAIADYSKAIELNPEYATAYNNRGIEWSKKDEPDKAIADYSKAIELNAEYATAYYNRGVEWSKKEEPDKAIADYSKAVELNPKHASAYYNRGNEWSNKDEPDKAFADYSKAIELNPKHADAYYNRGLLGNKNGKKLDERISDFRKYLELNSEQDDVWTKRANEFIKEFQEKITNSALKEISELTSRIKKLLLVKDGCITHYTGLTVSKKLIIEEENKFRISEGSFLNDTSEGTELFKFLAHQFSVRTDGMIAETFAPKPFIGSFVSEAKYDDLNLWRFYGKENGIEAKGCAITLKLKEFITAINSSISKGDDKANASSEDDISFYKVAYWNHDFSGINFHIPNSSKTEEKSLSKLMILLKEKVNQYKQEDTSTLEKHLNSIAFLFKSDAYKNENELRLVVKGIEFEKKIDKESNPPKVYIELVNIRKLIEQITIGPKVERAEEWAAAFHYSYDGETDENKPKKIKISRLPYK